MSYKSSLLDATFRNKRVQWDMKVELEYVKDGELCRYIRKGFRIFAERGWRAPSGKVHYALHMEGKHKPSPMTHCGRNTGRKPKPLVMVDGAGKPTVQITCLQCIHFLFGDIAREGLLPGCPPPAK